MEQIFLLVAAVVAGAYSWNCFTSVARRHHEDELTETIERLRAPDTYLPPEDERRGSLIQYFGVYCYQCGAAREWRVAHLRPKNGLLAHEQMLKDAGYRLVEGNLYCAGCADRTEQMIKDAVEGARV